MEKQPLTCSVNTRDDYAESCIKRQGKKYNFLGKWYRHVASHYTLVGADRNRTITKEGMAIENTQK